MTWAVATPPAAEPVTLAEARVQLRSDDGVTADDTLINSLIVAARRHIEQVCERALMPQTWRVSFDQFPDGALEVPGGLVRAIDSLKYVDSEPYTGTYVRSGAAVTVTLADHGHAIGEAVQVTSADDADLQGGQTVLTADAGTFTFADADAAGAASGSITVLGRWQTLTGYHKDLDRRPARLYPAAGAWPAVLTGKLNAVQVLAQVGYADAASVPAEIKAALLLIVEDLYKVRGTAIVGASYAETPTVRRLLWPYKRVTP